MTGTLRYVLTAGIAAFLVCGSDRMYAAEPYQWRGPAGDGVFPEFGLLREWPEGGPPLAWKKNIGATYSGATVVGEKVYVTGGLICYLQELGISSGNELRRTLLGPSNWKRYGGGSRQAPLIVGGTALSMLVDSTMYAVDLAAMEKKWAVNVWKKFNVGGNGGWGAGGVGASHDNRLLLNPCSRRDDVPLLVGVNVETGEDDWKTFGVLGSKYSSGNWSPPFRHRDRWITVMTSWRWIVAADANTGELLWQRWGGEGNKELAPMYESGRLCWQPQCTPRMGKGVMFQMLRLSEDGRDVSALWSRRGAMGGFHHGVTMDGRLYVFGEVDTEPVPGDAGRFVRDPSATTNATDDCEVEVTNAVAGTRKELLVLDAATGKLIASVPDTGKPAHIVAAEGIYYLDFPAVKTAGGYGNISGETNSLLAPLRVRLLKPVPSGVEIVGSMTIVAPSTHKDCEWGGHVAPTIAGGQLFVLYGLMHCFDLRADKGSAGWRGDGTGVTLAKPPLPFSVAKQRAWQARLAATGTGEPVAMGTRVLVADRAGLTCFDWDGKQLWRQTPSRAVSVPKDRADVPDPTPILAPDGSAFAVFPDGQTLACDAQGARRWEATIGVSASQPAVSPFLAQGHLVAQGREIICFDEAGKAKWRKDAPEPPRSRPWGAPAKAWLMGDATAVTAWGALIRVRDGKATDVGLPEVPAGASPVVDGVDAYWVGQKGDKGLAAAVRFPMRERQAVVARWRKELPLPATGVALLDSGLLSFLDTAGNLTVLLTDDGTVLSSRQVAGPADAHAGLFWTDKRLLLTGLNDRGIALSAGKTPEKLWEFGHEGRSAVCALNDRWFVRTGDRLHCIAGASADQAPAELNLIDIPASAALKEIPAGLPVWDLKEGEIPRRWLGAGGLPGRNLNDDPLAARGGRVAVPGIGDHIRRADTHAVFALVDDRHFFTYRGETCLDVSAVHGRAWDTTGMFALAVSNDRPRTVRWTSTTPAFGHWKERLDARVFLGGVEVNEEAYIRLPAGCFCLLIQTSMGSCETWGKIWIIPHFVDADWKAKQARYEERSAIHEDAKKPQTL